MYVYIYIYTYICTVGWYSYLIDLLQSNIFYWKIYSIQLFRDFRMKAPCVPIVSHDIRMQILRAVVDFAIPKAPLGNTEMDFAGLGQVLRVDRLQS